MVLMFVGTFMLDDAINGPKTLDEHMLGLLVGIILLLIVEVRRPFQEEKLI